MPCTDLVVTQISRISQTSASGRLTEAIDNDNSNHHDNGDNEEGYLAPFFHLVTQDNGIEAPLFKAGRIVFLMMMMVMVRVSGLFHLE